MVVPRWLLLGSHVMVAIGSMLWDHMYDYPVLAYTLHHTAKINHSEHPYAVSVIILLNHIDYILFQICTFLLGLCISRSLYM